MIESFNLPFCFYRLLFISVNFYSHLLTWLIWEIFYIYKNITNRKFRNRTSVTPTPGLCMLRNEDPASHILLPWLLNVCLGTCSHYSLDWRNTTNLDPDWTHNLWPNVMRTLLTGQDMGCISPVLAQVWHVNGGYLNMYSVGDIQCF